jgi:rhodanese-related sulfurtransferase
MKAMSTYRVSGDSSETALEKSTTWLSSGVLSDIYMKYQMIKKVDLKPITKIVLSGALLGVLAFLSQDNIGWASLFTQSHPTKQISDSKADLETIELPGVLRFFNSKDVIFLDVREKKYFDYGSIQGAENLPSENLSIVGHEALERWGKMTALVVYCNGVGCGTASLVARQLTDLGLHNVKIYVAGWPEWRSCHLPMTMSQAMKKEEEATRESGN